jgi:hypothetical protein
VALRWADRRSFRLVSSAKPAFDEVEPRGAGRGEVQVEAGVLQQPLVDSRGLVGGVVIQDQVQVQVPGHSGVDELEEAEEFLVPVPAVGLGDHRSTGQVERGEQAGGAVASCRATNSTASSCSSLRSRGNLPNRP